MDRDRAKTMDEADAAHSREAGSASAATPTRARPSATLQALTSSALALPGLAAGTAHADAPIERATSSGSFSIYLEDDLSPRKFESTTGSRERYEVYTLQMRGDAPVSERMDVGIDFLYEQMSGASPWYVVPGADGEQLQVMSGATIEDERIDATVDLDYYLDRGKDTFSAGFSLENDYTSGHFGLGAERHFNDKNTTLNFSGAFSYDLIEPTDPQLSLARPESEERWSVDVFAGLAQIVSRAATAQLTLNYKHSDGYLGDPYKAVTDVSETAVLSDERPSGKEQISILARYRHHLEPLDSSLHADYRFYADDWGIVSHTVELAWYYSPLGWLTITPSGRWYSQSQADFYEAILPSGTAPRHRSSDFRLSPYGAVSGKIKFDFDLRDLWRYDPPAFAEAFGVTDGLSLIASFSYERYFSDGDFGLDGIGEFDQAPALVDFQVFAWTLSGRF